MLRYPKQQMLQSLEIKDYSNVTVVCGSRDYNDKVQFHEKILEYIDELETPVLFISGAAHTGADDFIIRWCLKYKYPCLKVPADWDTYKKSAGYIRNEKMANLATHVLAFYDGKSNGTKNMLKLAHERNLFTRVILFKDTKNDHTHNQESLLVS